MRFSEFVEKSNAVHTPEEAFTLLEQACRDLGIDWLAYGALTNHVIYNARRYKAPAVVLNYPDDWVRHYFEAGYQDIDPVVTLTPSLRSPYLWDDLDRHTRLTDEQRRFMDQARDAGLRSGVSVPLHGPFGNVSVVSAACREDNPDVRHSAPILNALVAQFHNVYTDLVLGIRQIPPTAQLTERERECLLWSARGKSSWDIGMIVGISEHTVNFHLKNAMAKLEAGSRVVAIVKAIRSSLIVP